MKEGAEKSNESLKVLDGDQRNPADKNQLQFPTGTEPRMAVVYDFQEYQ